MWCVTASAMQTRQSAISRRCLQTHSLSPAGRSGSSLTSATFSTATSMPSIYIACSASAAGRSVSSPSESRHPPAAAPLSRPRTTRPSTGTTRAAAAGTCRGAGRPAMTTLSERTKTYTSVKTAVSLMADNQNSLSRVPISSGRQRAIVDEVSQQVPINQSINQSIGGRLLNFKGSQLWNRLPKYLINIKSHQLFKKNYGII